MNAYLAEDRLKEFNDVERNLVTAIEMFLYQVDRIKGADIHAANYQLEVEEQAIGMFRLVKDIAEGEPGESFAANRDGLAIGKD